MSSRYPARDTSPEPRFAGRVRSRVPGAQRAAQARPRAWVLRGGQGDLTLVDGEQLIGRGRHCDICLPDAQLSREHASILVLAHAIVVSDFGSMNGVRINGELIGRPQELQAGDELAIGQHVWQLLPKDDGPPTGTRASWGVSSTPTPQVSPDADDIAFTANPDQFVEPESGVVPKARRIDPPSDAEPKPGSGARRVDPDEAEGQLLFLAADLMESARAGASIDPEQCAEAARLAVSVAYSTHKGRWLEKMIELHTLVKCPLPLDVLDELYSLPREVKLDVAPLNAHVEWLTASSPERNPAHDYTLTRMQGFVRLMALRG